MRIVVSGTHASGKSTLISDFALRHPEFVVLPDPFEALDDALAWARHVGHSGRVPLLLGGAGAAKLAPLLKELGFEAKVASAKLGIASATKMCRSVMIKGLEAMVIESFTAARAYGVEDAVLASLYETFPGIDWEKQAAYFFQRVIEHGRRRSEEVREVAETVREIGLTPWSSQGTAERQAWIADLADEGLFGTRGSKEFARSADWRIEADRILAEVKSGN